MSNWATFYYYIFISLYIVWHGAEELKKLFLTILCPPWRTLCPLTRVYKVSLCTLLKDIHYRVYLEAEVSAKKPYVCAHTYGQCPHRSKHKFQFMQSQGKQAFQAVTAKILLTPKKIHFNCKKKNVFKMYFLTTLSRLDLSGKMYTENATYYYKRVSPFKEHVLNGIVKTCSGWQYRGWHMSQLANISKKVQLAEGWDRTYVQKLSLSSVLSLNLDLLSILSPWLLILINRLLAKYSI